ncbi:hypothetical protein K2X05_06895 [bacterium]|nr:hypothetical protein [bacterium]
MVFVLQFFLFLNHAQANAQGFTFEQPESVSRAYIEPVTQKKTILFQKSFESHRSDGSSDLDFFKSAVKTLELSAGDELHVLLQSDGGEISVGLNIHAFLLWLREKGVSITTQIPKDGFCHSICVPVFAAGNIRLADAEASFIIHPATFPEISDTEEKQAALDKAKSHYVKALSTADASFANFIENSEFLDKKSHEFFAKDLALSFPSFLKLFGDCGETLVSVIYADKIDLDLACTALETSRNLVKKEFSYDTNAPISIEFKPSVLFSLFDASGAEVSQEPVYGLYDRKKNRIEMSGYKSNIVQNPEREHFSLKIRALPLSDEEKNRLLLELHKSAIVHELTHLFTQHNFKDDNPSSAIHEYFSYVAQLKSLPQELLAQILILNPQKFTDDMQINSMIHFANPHQFGVMSYRHYEALGERKAKFIGDALTGKFRPDDLLEML